MNLLKFILQEWFWYHILSVCVYVFKQYFVLYMPYLVFIYDWYSLLEMIVLKPEKAESF